MTLEYSWWARQDSNLQPIGYEPTALTIELQARPRQTKGPIVNITTTISRNYGCHLKRLNSLFRLRCDAVSVQKRQKTSGPEHFR